MPIGLTLVDGFNDASTPTAIRKRQLIENSPSLQAFAEMPRVTWEPDPERSARGEHGPRGRVTEARTFPRQRPE